MWFTGNRYPGPITAVRGELKAFLDGGGKLFMSGQDILDQAAGTTAFVHDYLHINWDGTETQNDKPTANVHGGRRDADGNGLGTVPLDHSVLGATFEDQITPIAPAIAIFTDDAVRPTGSASPRNLQGGLPRLPVRGVRHGGGQDGLMGACSGSSGNPAGHLESQPGPASAGPGRFAPRSGVSCFHAMASARRSRGTRVLALAVATSGDAAPNLKVRVTLRLSAPRHAV